jgi:3-dehydroquinate dehydratase-2
MAQLILLNGPNLNLLGTREPEIYGRETLADVVARATAVARELGHELAAFQSNAEHELIDRIQKAPAAGIRFAIINPGGLTHTSVALRDAFAGVKLPFIELHLSNTFAREPFRHHSYLSDIAVGCIVGLGPIGYELAVRAAAARLAAADAPTAATPAAGPAPSAGTRTAGSTDRR